jgi:hypothetical protein
MNPHGSLLFACLSPFPHRLSNFLLAYQVVEGFMPATWRHVSAVLVYGSGVRRATPRPFALLAFRRHLIIIRAVLAASISGSLSGAFVFRLLPSWITPSPVLFTPLGCRDRDCSRRRLAKIRTRQAMYDCLKIERVRPHTDSLSATLAAVSAAFRRGKRVCLQSLSLSRQTPLVSGATRRTRREFIIDDRWVRKVSSDELANDLRHCEVVLGCDALKRSCVFNGHLSADELGSSHRFSLPYVPVRVTNKASEQFISLFGVIL